MQTLKLVIIIDLKEVFIVAWGTKKKQTDYKYMLTPGVTHLKIGYAYYVPLWRPFLYHFWTISLRLSFQNFSVPCDPTFAWNQSPVLMRKILSNFSFKNLKLDKKSVFKTPRDTRMLRLKGMCCKNGSFFCKKSLNMSSIFHEKSLTMGQLFKTFRVRHICRPLNIWTPENIENRCVFLWQNC